MKLSGEHKIPAPRERVWDALHDPAILQDCITGCQSLEMVGENQLAAKVTAKVGPVKATFDATVEIKNEVPPESYRLQGEGKGGVAGFAKGHADVFLEEDGEGTLMRYEANATVGGKLAQLGSRLVDSTAKRYASDFFECFSKKLGGGVPDEEPVPTVGEPSHEPATEPVAAASSPAVGVPPAGAPADSAIAPTATPATPAAEGGGRSLAPVFLVVLVLLAAGVLVYLLA